jgi:(p)ppGpp synthase/HD superfamily hydrolase
MTADFGERVVGIVLDVTKDDLVKDWHERSRAYLQHLEFSASDQGVIVSASDKIHNLMSTLIDYETDGEVLWDRFTTKSSADQVWWYQSILDVITRRNAPEVLRAKLAGQVEELKTKTTAV